MADLSQSFADYVSRQYVDNLLEVMAQTDATQHYSLVINFATLFEENIELGNAVVSDPEVTLPLFDIGLVAAQKNVLESIDDDKRGDNSVKINIHARIIGLPTVAAASHKTMFPRNEELGNFLKVVGTVVKVTLPKLMEYEREYRCSKCRNSVVVTADYNLNNVILPPQVCGNSCNSASFTAVKTCNGLFKDYQELKIQEDIGKLHIGTIPSSIWITVDHDLVDTCHPGDHVTIWGTVMRRWKGLTPGKRGEVELVVKANNLQVTNYQKAARLVTNEFQTRCDVFWEKYQNRPLEGRDLILASFCPEVYGLYLVKLAMCIVLCGGVPRLQEEGSFIRSESHLLLVGDPGTGKSQMLRFAAKTSTRSVLTTGVGCTSAGLTVCAVREGSDWQLEAGALVLADGGVCCIDELNSIREQDRTSIHEAMEQQTISVAKAGMVTKLNTRCSVLAATNAKGVYDPSESLSSNVALASPLLSRFDLVLVLQDTRSKDWDRMLSDFILEFSDISLQSPEEIWSVETLQSYFAYAKTFHPVMTQEANMVLSRYYQAQRGADDRNAARTTVRMLESLVRLSQGHARLMLRKEVTLLDAVVAVSLIECSMASSALVAATNALHASFPTDPNKQYRHQAELILEKLGLTDLTEKEVKRLNQVDDRLANESAGKTDGLIFEDGPDQTNLLSQRLTDILTGIKKKKDRDVCETAKLAGKRRRGLETRKKQKFRKVDDAELEEIEECDEPETEPETNNEKLEHCRSDERLNKVEQLEPVQRKPSKSTMEKLLMFKKASFSKGSGSEEATNEGVGERRCIPDDSMDLKGNPVYSSTPLKSVSSQHCAPLTLHSSMARGSTAENPSSTVPNLATCSKSSVDSLPVINETETIQPTSSQLNFKGYDGNKLKNLAKLGRSLSQSQRCTQASSQFSLHEMSWDDLDAEL